MTSRDTNTMLADALALVGELERILEYPDSAARLFYLDHAKDALFDFRRRYANGREGGRS